MNSQTRRALMQLSVPTDIIDRIAQLGHTLANLRSFSFAQLTQHYTADEAELLARKVKRQPISDESIESILAASGETCAYCADGNRIRPYEVHHIEPYAVGQDNSEDNLLLVCPNHHAWIHKTSEQRELQKAKRREWYATAALGRAYADTGVPFPFGIFEPIDYSYECAAPVAVALLTSGHLGPREARMLCTHSLAARACTRLLERNFLLVVGRSGSGKSTLAVGIAGVLAEEGTCIFRYRRRVDGDARGALTEVLMFLGLSVSPSLLILDDINTWATAADLQCIAAASSSNNRVLATWTGGRLADDPTAELHVFANRMALQWDDLREASIAIMLAEEDKVVPFIQALRKTEHHPVGFDVTSRSLKSLMLSYAEKTQSIWEFLFLLRGAWTSISEELGAMFVDGRADVPVLHAAIEQIAGVERPVSVAEATRFTRDILDTDNGSISETWVAGVFESLSRRRLIVRVRDAYTTIHREWARALICCALKDYRTQTAVRKLLARDFDVATKSPRRLMILWSWLQNDADGGAYVRGWVTAQEPSAWRILVGASVSTGLTDTAMVASQLHRLFYSQQWDTLVGEAFEAHEHQVAALVCAAGPEDWDSVRELLSTIKHSRPQLAARVIAAWPAETAATVLAKTVPEYYQTAGWVLSGIREHSPAWCDAVGRVIDWDAMAANFSRVRTGDLSAFFWANQILEDLRIPLLRSRARQLTRAMALTMTGASLEEIQFQLPFGPLWLELYSEDVREIVAGLEPDKLAAELSAASPRSWGRLLMLSDLAQRHGSDFPRRLVDLLGNALLANVERFGASSAYEFRRLLWQLTYGSPDHARSLAANLLPLAQRICVSVEHEVEPILKAYAVLDLEHAQRLCVQLGRALPDGAGAERLRRPVLDATQRDEISRLESAGEDYDVARFMRSDDEGVV